MAFDSRWDREHGTLQSQLSMLDGLDVGLRRLQSRPAGSSHVWRRVIGGLRALSLRLRAILAL